MKIRDWLPASYHMVAIFTVVAAVSATALGLLSWQLLEQDRLLETPRRRGMLEAVADEAIRTLSTRLAHLDAVIAHEAGATPPAGVSVVAVTLDRTVFGSTPSLPSSVVAVTSDRTVFGSTPSLPFVPTRSLREADSQLFVEASALEFKEGKREQARTAYEKLTTHPDSAVRATALARLAALRRQSGDLAGALRDYDALSALVDAGVDGLPAGLIAAVGRASALKEHDQRPELRGAAANLARDLARGRWPLRASEFELYYAQASEWLGTVTPRDRDAIARADAVEVLWQQRASLGATGRRLLSQPRGVAIVVWRAAGDGLEAVIGGPAFLGTLISDAVPPGFAASVSNSEGHQVLGSAPAGNEVATRAASDAVPWTLQISPGTSGTLRSDAAPQRLLFLVMGVTVVVLGAGWYFIARARGRELRVARLQNDFVGAVSHEFRSPLTSLAHLSELLAQNRLPTDALRQKAYDVLVGDTARLRELVEHLLDFGRFDSGTIALRLERVELDTLVAGIVDDARRRVVSLGYTIDFSPSSGPTLAEVDKDALGRAIWNLIDNAVKYSPDCRTVWVAVERHENGAAITVRDQGLGIPLGEQAGIFERFVRGEESKSRRIKGTGIGLALVRQIVDAHGGKIELTSAVGEGSRFVVRLRAAGGIG